MTPFLECGPLNARTGEGRVLFENVSVSLSESECVCLDGPSGSGKSTLLRLLTALAWSPDVSRQLDGRTYRGAELPAWRANVSLIAQDAPMIRGSVLDNLSFPFLQRAGDDRQFAEMDAKRLLEKVGLGEVPFDRDVLRLSGGERHRLALVRSLLWDPPVLVADEVLSGLDPDAAEACLDLLVDFSRKQGRLLICVLHDPALCSAADRCLHLRDGHLEEN
ncbi:MAG: ATP-binding cassette domain-containing protein [Planctomycetes bacterium]|nr:ATP-binding cassette domain-containing protein [Planctomycetota bacterium]